MCPVLILFKNVSYKTMMGYGSEFQTHQGMFKELAIVLVMNKHLTEIW